MLGSVVEARDFNPFAMQSLLKTPKLLCKDSGYLSPNEETEQNKWFSGKSKLEKQAYLWFHLNQVENSLSLRTIEN